ncbi:replication initiation and membrane attachment family protein [Pediococcus siamensis]|uniref:replication initiation and membrane attachment family protein n=1 Tax=Pediococcus siamensis TaxID=381829 RepID=UPI0039A1FB72
MNEGWANLSPKDGFLVTQQAYLSDFDQKVLTYLYQPIIGAKAFSLFLTLWTELQPGVIRSQRKSHLELLDILNCDLPDFFAARQKLEGLGLLKTFSGSDTLGRFFVYQLVQPVAPDSFFKDGLLSSLLLEAVGEKRFTELAKQFKLVQVDVHDLKNVSTDFLSAFHISEKALQEPSLVIRETQAEFKQASQAKNEVDLKADHTGFDFKLLQSLIKKGFTTWDSVNAAQKLILTEHLLYGVDEVEMARQIAQATDLMTNKLDPQKLQRQFANHFTGRLSNTTNYVTPAPVTSEKQDNPKSTDDQKLTAEDLALVKAAKAYAPATYLENLKQAVHGGYVTYGEKQTLKNLIERNLFPVSVINILISYIILDREATTLPNKLVDTVANSWSRAHVTTPEAAIIQIKQFAQAKQRNTKSQTRRQVAKETLPDWAKNEQETKQNQQTPTVEKGDQQRLQRRLSELRRQHKEEK